MEKIAQPLIIDNFRSHIDNESNKRILFSAPFGAGKSTFLNDFFDGREDEFIAVKLYPVNYAVSENNDVFELIKFDILCELLGKHKERISLQKEEFPILLKSQLFAINHLEILPIIEAIISASSKVGKAGVEILKALMEIYPNYKKFASDTKIDDAKLIENYLERFSDSGGVHEMDDMTHLISNLLTRSKDGSGLKSVLIIDDLDRLDPEHVFRLFNVFSAHYDGMTQKNKFNFEKVIFVCDIKNIRKMFYHRYGIGVDFSGYIDKFYSKRVFEFDNSEYLKQNLEILFSKIGYIHAKASISDQYLVNTDTSFRKGFFYLLHSLITSKQLSLRSFAQVDKLEMPLYSFKVNTERRNSSPAIMYPFLVLISYLKSIFTDVDTIAIVLEHLADTYDEHVNVFDDDYDNQRSTQYLIEISLIFLVSVESAFITEFENRVQEMYHFDNNYIHYSISSERMSEFAFSRFNYIHVSKITQEPNYAGNASKINVFRILSLSLKNCLKRLYVK